MLLRKGGGRSVGEGCAEDDGAPYGAESDVGGGVADGFCCDAFCRFAWPWGLPQKVLAIGALWAGGGSLNSEITFFCTFARRESSEVHHVGRAK